MTHISSQFWTFPAFLSPIFSVTKFQPTEKVFKKFVDKINIEKYQGPKVSDHLSTNVVDFFKKVLVTRSSKIFSSRSESSRNGFFHPLPSSQNFPLFPFLNICPCEFYNFKSFYQMFLNIFQKLFLYFLLLSNLWPIIWQCRGTCFRFFL